MPVDANSEIEITAFDWVPEFARGLVRDLRPRWACEELGLPYRERLISARNRPEWYFAEQPWGQVPCLRDGEVHLFESGAILLHLAEREGGLVPAGGQPRADALSWLFAAFNSVEPGFMELANVNIFSAGQDWAEARKPGLMDQIGKKLDKLAEALGEREWLAEEFSIADIAMITILRIPRDSELVTARPSLLAYRERGEARPAFKAALEAQLAAFKTEQPA
jgi:glutathione S-transferase